MSGRRQFSDTRRLSPDARKAISARLAPLNRSISMFDNGLRFDRNSLSALGICLAVCSVHSLAPELGCSSIAMKCILFADDNKNIREFCKQELEAEGYRVLLATDGKEAVRLAKYGGVDLAILDVRMPGVDGLEAAARIKAIAPAIAVVFFTADCQGRMPERWSELALGWIAKSNDLRELKRLCAVVLQSADAPPCPPGIAESAKAEIGTDRQV
jgi:CheY-like chemotaxis protein